MWKDKLFWFSQPSIILNTYDNYFLWAFLVLTGFGLILRLISRFAISHPIVSKLVTKFANACWINGLTGLIWYGLRYENTPFFADRYWAALVVLILLVRLLYIIKYIFTSYGSEKTLFDKMQLNSKYIPGRR